MPLNEPPLPPSAVPVAIESFGFSDGARRAGVRQAAVETAVNIVYAPMPFAVMMCSPQDLEDFAIGFSFTEGIIDTIDDIRSVHVEEDAGARGLKLVVSLASDKMRRHLARARNISGRTGCGVCGIDDLDAMPCARAIDAPAQTIEAAAVARALRDLVARQELNSATGAVHAAAWCAPNGDVTAIREDVGRHNALDKLIGHLLRTRVAPDSGFFVITSRCSFEMLEKVAAFGARTVVAISAPTSLAIERARLHGVTLIALARNDSAIIFNGAEHVRTESPA
ncbi:MAG: formate dehydrogenase accessory sulfurtransferase FdhD [Hyphomicrobiales bacterium]|nr:formate dehydrogenase accessory sulfurtransferase FdhD [Hyphomicrobiales bacterium]